MEKYVNFLVRFESSNIKTNLVKASNILSLNELQLSFNFDDKTIETKGNHQKTNLL